MQIVQTLDAEKIRATVTHTAIWPHVSDDSCSVETYAPPLVGFIWLEVVDVESLGVYLVHPHNFITYEIHTCLLPEARGAKARQAGALVLDWIFTNTPCLKVITQVPESNPLALRYAKRCGLVVEGNNRQSYIKNGNILDMIQLGITKKEHKCQQQYQ